MASEISTLRAQGYLPVMTFQYNEYYQPNPTPEEEANFRRMADAGAVIVSGSQAHMPASMEFHGNAFVHYGLGNLFFDQMSHLMPDGSLIYDTRNVFIDRHIIYDGRYIGTELLTAMLEDYARPRPMTPDERAAFLSAYFGYSGWLPLIPTPAPEQTPTLYPLLNFNSLPTHNPMPLVTPTP